MSDNASSPSFSSWIGRSETSYDVITAAPINALAATLNRSSINSSQVQTLPPLWHWLYFLPTALQSTLGEDGHPERGGFLPPITLPRRMWAGSQLTFHNSLFVGDAIKRISSIDNITEKQGSSGKLAFVRVKHEISQLDSETPSITEYHDIVYREPPTAQEKAALHNTASVSNSRTQATQAQWQHTVTPDPVLLFRYSALTFNGHRIHYDRQYVTEVEGYPGLVVHGPLLATLLLELIATELNNPHVVEFLFKAKKPIFDTHPFSLCATLNEDSRVVLLSVFTHNNQLAMEAKATLASPLK